MFLLFYFYSEYYVEVAPYWNVNLLCLDTYILLCQVEVAPYWNVNILGRGDFEIAGEVEVAPYWNVNFLSFICL